MKKVLYIITKSNWGGAQRYVYDLATELAGEFNVVVGCGGDGALVEKLRGKNIRTIVIPSLQRDVAFGADVRSFFELCRLFKKEKPNIVHLNSSKAGGVGALAARMSGVPKIIFTAHGWPFWEPRNIFAREFIWLASWLTALLSHQVIVVSDYDLHAAQYMPFCDRKTVRIYNGINLDMKFGPGDIIRSAYPRGVTIVGTIGELNKNKNQQALLKEAQSNPDMYVAVVGEGEERAALENKIKAYGLSERVKLFGFIPASEVMRGFDRFVLPSVKEALGYVILEARCAGLPITTNRVGGVGEALDKDLKEFSLEQMVQKTVALYQS